MGILDAPGKRLTDPVPALDMRYKGVKADGAVNFTGAMVAGSAVITLTTTTARNSYSPGFDAALDVGVGKVVNVAGAGDGGAILYGTIVSVQSATQATMSVPAVIDSRGPRTLTGLSSTYDPESVPNSQVFGFGVGDLNAADLGRKIFIAGTDIGGPDVDILVVIVEELLSSTTFRGSKCARATLSGLAGDIGGAEVTWGTDNTAAIVAMMDSSVTDFRHIGASGFKWPPGIILISAAMHYFGGMQFEGSGASPDLSNGAKGTVFKAVAPWDFSRRAYMLDTYDPTFGGAPYSHAVRFKDFALDGSNIPGLSGLRIWQGGEAVDWGRIYARRCPGSGIKFVGDFANLYAGPFSCFDNGVGYDFEDAAGAVTLMVPSGDDNTTFLRVRNYVNGLAASYGGLGLNLIVAGMKIESRIIGKGDPAIVIDDNDGGAITFIGGVANQQVVGWDGQDLVQVKALVHATNPAKVRFVAAPYANKWTYLLNNIPLTRKVLMLVAGTHPDITCNTHRVLVNSLDMLMPGSSLRTLQTNNVNKQLLAFDTDGGIRLAATAPAGLQIRTAEGADVVSMATGSPGTLDTTWAGHLLPAADNATDLGSAALSFRDLFVDRAAQLPGVRFRGAWGATTAYVTGDVVAQNGRLWLAPSDFTSGSTFRPASWVALGQQAPPWGVGTMLDPIAARSTDTTTFAGTGAPSIFFRLQAAGSATKVRYKVGVASGNIEFTLHTNTGSGDTAYPGAKIGGTGSVACPAVVAAGNETNFVGGELSWYAGDWLGIAADNVTATLRAVLSSGEVSDLAKGRCWISTVYPIQSNPGSVPGDLTAYSGKLPQVLLR